MFSDQFPARQPTRAIRLDRVRYARNDYIGGRKHAGISLWDNPDPSRLQSCHALVATISPTNLGTYSVNIRPNGYGVNVPLIYCATMRQAWSVAYSYTRGTIRNAGK